MKKYISGTVLLVLWCFACSAQSGREILEKSAEVLKQFNLFKYSSSYRIKQFDEPDTTELQTFSSVVLKQPSDSIARCYASLKNDLESRLYNGTYFYSVMNGFKKVIRVNPHVTMYGMGMVHHYLLNDHIPGFIYSTRPFNRYLTKGQKFETKDLTFHQRAYWQITIAFAPAENYTSISEVIWIDKKTYLPFRVMGNDVMDGKNRYWEHTLENLTPEQTNESTLPLFSQIPADYAVEDRVEGGEVTRLPLNAGSEVGKLVALNLDGKGVEVNLNDGKLYLLDFWFLSCKPCIKAIPALVALKEQFGARGLVIYGLNAIDQASRIPDVKKLIEKHKINYELLTTDRSTDDQFSVSTYPTLFLVKNGKVLFSHVGFQNNLDDVEKVIRENLGN
jgi:thiol-disulfide isomerase/thioredoxin